MRLSSPGRPAHPNGIDSPHREVIPGWRTFCRRLRSYVTVVRRDDDVAAVEAELRWPSRRPAKSQMTRLRPDDRPRTRPLRSAGQGPVHDEAVRFLGSLLVLGGGSGVALPFWLLRPDRPALPA